MAWSVIADSVLQVGRPIRALTMRLLRDNITALANGDAGAPRIQRNALQPLAIDTARLENGNVTAPKLATSDAERDWVLARIAAADAGGTGTPVFAVRVGTPGVSQAVNYGSTYAGSDLRVAGLRIVSGVVVMTSGGSLTGTWRALGNAASTVEDKQTLFVRIA